MRLFNAFSATGYHTSLVSTFGVDFEAYEAIALLRLRDAGCNNNVLMADARMLGQALEDDARRPKFAGRRYSVVGASSAGVFHPKLVLQLGKTSGRLLVMSANMTAAGLAGNFEVVGEVAVDEDSLEAAPLLRAALDYFLVFLDSASAARRQVEWALKRTRWLPPSTDAEAAVELEGGMRLAFLPSNAAKGIGERFIEFVGTRAVKRLVVVSPYWDSDLHTLASLRNRFGAAKVATVIQPQSALYPTHAHPSEGLFELFDVNNVRSANASRFAHAKVFIAESDAGDCMLFGSTNCTRAALGTAKQPGINAEACLFRDLPPGEAVRLLGLEDALSQTKLSVAEVPPFTPAEEIPLSDLEAKLPGRFELSGDLLRWWPSTSFSSADAAVVELFDQQAEVLAGALSRTGTQSSPVAYRFDGAVAPHFARVRSGAFESSLGIVVVEQAIHESQRRAAGRGVESALELLDEDASEGLWLLEVIQRLTEAEREMRGPRGTSEAPNQKPSADAAADSQILSYEAFVAGRRSPDGATAAAGSHLASSHHESVRGFLNALIGKRAAFDLADELSDDGAAPNLSMGDETKDAAAALESGDLQPVDVAQTVPQDEEAKKQLLRRQRYVQDTQRSIVDGVGAFLKTLRDDVTGGRTLGVIDLLRLRALLVVVLGAGSKKTNLLPRDLAAQVHRRQVLPSNSGEESWLRLVGRLLYDLFRDHGGTRAPLVNSLALEPDEDRGLPEDVLECWATCFWAICAIRVAVNDSGVPAQTANTDLLARDLYRFVRLLPEQALGNVVREVFAGMSRRYGERLGTPAEAIEGEHRALVAAVHAKTAPSH